MVAPAVLYFVLVALALLCAFTTWAARTRLFRAPVTAIPSIVLITTLGVENLYYGLGRVWPTYYEWLGSFWPGVVLFKAIYIGCLAFSVLQRVKL
jgi:hypothetical protein